MKINAGHSRFTKYQWLEIIFFIVFFFAFPVLTDIEYDLKERPCATCNQANLEMFIQRFVCGIFQVPAYWFLYKILLHRILLRKKYLFFAGAYILFLFALDFYTVYVEYWSISHMRFLPASVTKAVLNWYQRKEVLFHFSIIYVLNQTLVFAALAYFVNFSLQEEKLNAVTQAKLQSDLNYLRAQVQPHFFFNTLNNIYSLAQQQSADTAPLVAKLAEMMRYVIYETARPVVPLLKEIEFLKNYVDIQSVRFNKEIKISFQSQGINETAYIEPMLLLPFIENIFKHGLQEEAGKGFAEIIICLEGNELMLEARNSKPGAPVAIKEAREKGKKIFAKQVRTNFPSM